jgi:mRNA-degrading endonuclease RelE of RelBE toxin-antitoxin system
MDKIKKALKKLTTEEREIAKAILAKIDQGNFSALNIKKLKGRQDIYRVRQGKIRIIYRIGDDKKISVLTLGRKNDNTYND